jgi:hypothetical protein
MRSAVASLFGVVCTGFILSALPLRLGAQEATIAVTVAGTAANATLPESPLPQPAGLPSDGQQQPPGQQTAPAPGTPAQNGGTPNATDGNGQASGATPAAGAGQSSSSSQSTPPDAATPKSQKELADEQLKQQEKQRVMGVMATFNTTRDPNAVPLTSGQKFKLFFKSATDPWPFLLAGVVSSFDQASNSPPEWGQGWGPYAERFGADYSDYFIGNFFGNAVLPSLLHEDPRYFQKGKGKVINRILWAAGSSFWCKRDNGGWGPNWANVGGNFIGTAIARAYRPASERNWQDTLQDGLTVTIEGMPGAELIEFWPDIVRAHRRKQAEKLSKEEAAKVQHPVQDKKPEPDQKSAPDQK